LIEKLRGKNVVKVFASNGCEHVIALTNNGKVYTFGFNVKGQLGHGDQNSLSIPKMVESLSRKFVTTVGCSYYHTVFSCSNELESYACGRNDYG
jgi:RCC1 and BTB domain-containing protein